jgi:hypothetical protein
MHSKNNELWNVKTTYNLEREKYQTILQLILNETSAEQCSASDVSCILVKKITPALFSLHCAGHHQYSIGHSSSNDRHDFFFFWFPWSAHAPSHFLPSHLCASATNFDSSSAEILKPSSIENRLLQFFRHGNNLWLDVDTPSKPWRSALANDTSVNLQIWSRRQVQANRTTLEQWSSYIWPNLEWGQSP